MAKELISPKTRLEFREHFVGTTLSQIADAFDLARISCDPTYDPPLSGQRRTLVEQYYRTLDFTRWDDVKKVTLVYEHVLDKLEQEANFGSVYEKPYAVRTLENLRRCLERDGFTWTGGRLVAASGATGVGQIQDAVASLDAPEINRQLTRLRDAVSEDPALAIGTAKEILETTCKTILEDLGVVVASEWDVPELLKQTRKQLKLLPDDVPASAKGAETIRRLLSNLGQLGVGLSELRNLYGSGHGRSGQAKGLSSRHARLAVGAVATLVQFLFETHVERKSP